MAIHIKNALKRFPKLANKQDNIQNLPSNTIKIFIVYDKNDEALFNKLVQLLHDLHLTNPALYWDYVEESEIEKESWSGSQQRHPSATFGTAHIVLLLVNADFHDNNAYYKDYVQRAWERYKSGKARVIQVLLSNASPVPDWSQESMAFGDFAERIREVIEALNSSNP